MLSKELVRTAKLHFSNVLGLLLVLSALYEVWLAMPLVPIVWAGLYCSEWGRDLWRGRPFLLLQMLSIPICVLPIVLARHFAEGWAIYISALALVAFVLINVLARDQHDEALSASTRKER